MLYSLYLFIIITMNKNNGCHSSLLRIFSRMLSLFPFVFVFLLFIYLFFCERRLHNKKIHDSKLLYLHKFDHHILECKILNYVWYEGI